MYDRNGSSYCGRLWWMLQWLGHANVAVLDGGLQAWVAAGGPLAHGSEPAHFQSLFRVGASLRRLATVSDVLQNLGQPHQTIIDARATPRYRGEVEPLDPVAGHIPGALNPPPSCGPSLKPCWRGATPPAWCTTAAAASPPTRMCWPWNEQALEKPRFLPAAGANGAATLPARSSADKLREHAQTAGHRTGMVALTGAPLVRQIPTRPAAKPDTLRSQTPT